MEKKTSECLMLNQQHANKIICRTLSRMLYVLMVPAPIIISVMLIFNVKARMNIASSVQAVFVE